LPKGLFCIGGIGDMGIDNQRFNRTVEMRQSGVVKGSHNSSDISHDRTSCFQCVTGSRDRSQTAANKGHQAHISASKYQFRSKYRTKISRQI